MKKPDPTLTHDSILDRMTSARQALEATMEMYRQGSIDTMTCRTLIYGASILLAYLEAERQAGPEIDNSGARPRISRDS